MKKILARRAIVGCLTAITLATNLPFHPEPSSDPNMFRMEDRIRVFTLITLARCITEDDVPYSDYKKIRLDINCDGVVDIIDYAAAANHLQKCANVEADMLNHENEWRSVTESYCCLLAEISGCSRYDITTIQGVYPDLILPFINIGIAPKPIKYVVEQVFSYSDGGGYGTVTSMPDPYFNTIGYEKEIEAGKTVMTLIVYQYKDDGITTFVVGTADYII